MRSGLRVALSIAPLISCCVSADGSSDERSPFADVMDVTTLIPASGEAYDLFEVRDVRTLSDGRVAVLNAGAHEILVFSSSGRFLDRFGRRGQGPGEFVRPVFMGTVAGDSILVTELALPQRTTVFTSDGEVARTFTLDTLPSSDGGSLYAFPIGITSDRLLVAGRALEPVTPSTTAGVRHIPSTTMLYDLEGSLRRIIQRPDQANEYFLVESGGQLRILQPPPRRFPLSAVGLEGVAFAMTDADTVTIVTSDGRERGTLRTPRPRMPRTSSMWGEMRREWAAEPDDEGTRRLRTQAARDAPLPAGPPLLSDLEFDRTGRIWVREETLETEPLARWHVHDETVPLGYVDLSAALEVREIGADYVLGVVRDQLDVETIVRVRLRIS
jgi:hypothetical protein